MHSFEICIFVLTALYLLGLVSFLPGLIRGLSRNPPPNTPPDSRSPSVTVLICARNEENNIEKCLQSLAKLNYPSELLEILVVDDRSSDSTPLILAQWINRLPNLRTITTQKADNPEIRGKINALIHGMDEATGEFVVITDADCVVTPNWVREHLRWYEAETGMVSSITVLDSPKSFDRAQSLEMTELLGLSMAAINFGIPVSVIGNNLSIRKQTYQEIGGYRNIPFSVTEDVALFQKVWDTKKWKVRFKANNDLLVLSQPPDSFKTWWRQKHRWVIGGKDIKIMGKLILLLGFIGAFVLVAAPITLSVNMAILIISIKCLSDLIIIYPTLRAMKQTKLTFFFFAYQLYLFFFLICVPILYSQKDVKWKGRVYHT